MLEQEQYKPLREELAQNPGMLRHMLDAIDASLFPPDDCFVDALLGIPYIDGGIEDAYGTQYINRYNSPERAKYQGSSFSVIRDILRKVRPGSKDIVYDLGCGYGRVILYGALTTEAKYKGIELVSRRVEKARSIIDDFQIGNAQIIRGNVLSRDLSDGTIFYLFNPFSEFTTGEVIEKLRTIARSKLITIASFWMREDFDKLDWLQRISDEGEARLSEIGIYRSLPV